MSEFFQEIDFTFTSRIPEDPLTHADATRIRRRLHSYLRKYRFPVTELHGCFNWNTQGLECLLNEFTNNTLHIILKVDYVSFFHDSSMFCLIGAPCFVMECRNQEHNIHMHCEVYAHTRGKIERLTDFSF